ncbi:MAG: exodeoxyribonuclease III [Nitriliruptorales bacterium]|nr:exodeoxyribonuclease III [Nitriliruptorales bacterium]
MLIVTWNVNSLNARMPRVLELLDEHRPDVVALQETKCAPEQFPHLELKAAGYESVDHSGGRWAGVAVLVRDDHDVEDRVIGLPGEPDPGEARWVEAVVGGIRVVSVYVINGRTLDDPMFAAKLAFLDAMQERVAALDGDLVVTGDFNIAPRDEDVYAPEQFVGGTHVTVDERTRLAAIQAAGDLADAFLAAPERGEHEYTWWDYRAGHFHKNLGLRIDLALTSPAITSRLEWVGIARDYRKGAKPSDHAPLLVRLTD